MSDKRVRVWVQRFKDRPTLMLQWLDPETGKRKSKSAETADERVAEDKRADLESDLNAGRYAEASRMTWETFRGLFEAEYLPNVRPKTRPVFDNVCNLFERLCHTKALRSVNERTISAFVTGLRKLPGKKPGTTMQPYSVFIRLRFLHVILQWAADQGLLPKVPKFPKVTVPKKKPQPVPAESFERLLAKAPDQQTRAFLLCGWLGGLRLAEVFSLEWEETTEAPYLDLARDRIVFPAEFVKAVEDQAVPLDAELRAALEALPRHGRKVFRFVDGRAPGSDRLVTEDALGHRVVKLAKKAGVKLSMHTLRKGFGCYYAARVPAQVLQKLMRHADIKVTMDYYANVDAAAEEAVRTRQRNTSRNTPAPVKSPADTTLDTTPGQ